MKFWTVMIAFLLLAGCTALPNATAPASTPAHTVAPAATQAPGSTEAAPLVATVVAPTSGAAEPATDAPAGGPAPASTEIVMATGSAMTSISTTAPEATMPPAPTAPATPEAAPAITCIPGALTPEQTEGPYYKANPPEASDLLQAGMGGTKLTISGYVLDAECKPVPGARVDFWQADSEGQYDNQGYTLRGYQVTDAQGRYQVETVVPGLYPGRTRHIHVKITPPNGQTLTTQLYFPDEAANARDQIFSPALIMQVKRTSDGEAGSFDFVVPAS